MAEFLRAFAIDTGAGNDLSLPVRFVASTEGMKRDGINLRARDWDLSRYEKHSVVLWGHDKRGIQHLPIGTAAVSFDGTDMIAEITYDRDDKFAQRVRSKAIKKMVAASVFWDPVRVRGHRMNQLVEISNVPVPLDPDTLVAHERAGMRSFVEALDKMLDDDSEVGEGESPEATWERVAGRMARLFAPGADDDDTARLTEYKALLPEYRRAGKQPPEFRLLEELTALTPELVRGLFISGELELSEITAMFDGEVGIEEQIAELAVGMAAIMVAIGISAEPERGIGDDITPEEQAALARLAKAFEKNEMEED